MVDSRPTSLTTQNQTRDVVPGKVGKLKARARAGTDWCLLCAYTACCIILALVIALAVNGYNAIDTSTPRYSSGHLQLRVSDVTTLISVGLVIVKLFIGAWTAIAVWRCAYVLTHPPDPSLDDRRISFMKEHHLPPWIMWPFRQPQGAANWAIALLLFLLLAQTFLAPLLSGAVNWNPSSVPSGKTVQLNDTNQNAWFGDWYYYNLQQVSRQASLRIAAGIASLAWADSAALAANGTSLTGNGCRHVVNSGTLPVNSTVRDIPIPCIQIHDITWAMSDADIPRTVSNLVEDANPLSLVDDDPELYYSPGQAVLFDPDHLFNTEQSGLRLPPAIKFSGSLDMGLLISRPGADGPACTAYGPTAFGPSDKIQPYQLKWNKNCYLIGTVRLTAGVTRSAESTFISSRVIEDQTPLSEVVFEPNSWVQNALWLLPDLMTMIAVMNSSQLPTWDNIDGYSALLIRQAYLAAWDMFHANFDMDGPVFAATPQEQRIKASVSFSRVFAWLGVYLVTTAAGVLLLLLARADPRDGIEEHRSEAKQVWEGIKDSAKEIAETVSDNLGA